MNWTGGSLYRSRNANASLTAVQKKHFAKVRAKLNTDRSSPRPSPFAFLDQQLQDQRTLHDFEATQPIARKLDSIKPRRRTIKRERSSTSSRERDQAQHSASKSSRRISISSRSTSPSSSSEQDQDDCRPMHQNGDDEETNEPLERQRRLLLDKGDWMGIGYTRPAQIKFTSAEDRELIGKRRRLSQIPDYDRARRSKQRLKRTSYFDTRSNARLSQDALSQADISVRIGSAVDRSVRHGRPYRQASSEREEGGNEMLLDDDVENAEDRYPNPFRNGHLASDVDSRSQREPPTSQYWRSSPPQLPPALTSDRKAEKPRQRSKHKSKHATKLAGERDIASGATKCGSCHTALNTHVGLDQFSFTSARRSSSPAFHSWSSMKNLEAARQISQEHTGETMPSSDIISVKDRAEHPAESINEGFDGSPAPISVATEQHPAEASCGTSDMDEDDTVGQTNAINKTRAMENEETLWKELFDLDTTSSAMEETNNHCDLQERSGPSNAPIVPAEAHHAPEPDQAPTTDHMKGAGSAAKGKASEPVDDEEALWRSFVFGDESSEEELYLEEPVTTSQSHNKAEQSSSTQAYRTQPSVIAEVGTSPIKQNPHLLEEQAASDATSTSPSGPDKASAQAQAHDSENADGRESKFDDLLVQCSSDASLHQRHAPSSTQPERDPASPEGPSPSTRPQPSRSPTSIQETPPNVQASKSDELWQQHRSPSISSQALSHQAQASSEADLPNYSPQLSTQRRQPVVFKAPERYQGKYSDTIEPFVIGATVGRRRVSERLRAEKELMDDELRGLGFGDAVTHEHGSVEELIDDIEDD